MKFKSLQRENIWYEWAENRSPIDTPDYFYRNPRSFVNSSAYEFDTMGDGSTQHTPSILVDSRHIVDFLASFNSYLIEHPENLKAVHSVYLRLEFDKKQIAFFSKLRFNPEKQVYYNKETCKTSSADSKRHDKRWEIVPDWADGSLLAVVRFMSESYRSYLEYFALVYSARESLYDLTGCFYDPSDFLGGIDSTSDKWLYYSQSYRSFKSLLDSYREFDNAKRTLQCLISNLGIGQDLKAA